MFISKKHLSRRAVLQGMGVTIGLPLLEAMIPAATAQSKTAAKPAPRMGFIYVPHGSVLDRWSPKTTGKDFQLLQILKPLEPYKSHLTIVSGLRNKAAESPAPHAITSGTWLGCVHPAPQQSPLAGTSTDQIAAKHIGQDTPFPSLELSTETGTTCDPTFGCGFGNTISFRTPTQPLPMEYNPRKVFYQLFGQGDTTTERAAIVGETKSILDSVLGDAASLQQQLGPRDRAMVGSYLDSLREIERRIQTVEKSNLSRIDVPDAPVGVPNDFKEHVSLMFDLLAIAYQANLTRVFSFMMNKEVSMRTFNAIGVSDAFHPLSHHGNNPANLDRLSKVFAYHTDLLSAFIKKLATTPDGDGSLLDHSIILYGSNMSNSNLHNHDPLPSAVLGLGYGKIKGGQHLKYPQDTPLANLMLTLLERAGVPIDHIGDSNALMTEV
ncbi:MAG TPA: DUF1552 domain-containing protein [Bryobacteraceae bacterium]|nr:DUF1552 domain-containing protein [Bryobacteraceae bacterium]